MSKCTYFYSSEGIPRFMGRMPKLIIIAVITAVAIVGAIAISDVFKDKEPTLRAEVIEVQHGNTIVLDIGMDDLVTIGAEINDDILVKTGNLEFTVLFSPGSGYKGIPMYGGYLADAFGTIIIGFTGCDHVTIDIKVGDILTLSREGKDPFIDKIPNYLKGRTNNPEDYDGPTQFANTREVKGGDLVPGSIYRSASPWNAGNRSPFVNDYYKEIGAEYLICINLDEDEVAEYVGKDPDAYASRLFKEGKVSSKHFRAAVHSSPDQWRFIVDSLLEAEGKTGIFCTYGKDRTGFSCAMIEGLAGANYDEILADFMTSMCNYYHIEVGSEEYEAICKNYPQRVFYLYDHTELIEHPEKVDWNKIEFEKFDPEEVFTKYLVDYVGIDADKVAKVKEKLTGGI